MEDGKIWFEMNHIGTAEAKHGLVYETDYWNSGTIKKQGAADGMARRAAIADMVYGSDASYKKATLTDERLKEDTLAYLIATGKDMDVGGGFVFPSAYGYQYWGEEAKAEYLRNFEEVWNSIGKQDLGGPGFWDVAAWQISKADKRWKVANYDDQICFAAGMADLIASGNDPVSTSLNIIRDAVDNKIQIELKFLDGQGRTKATMLLDKVQGGVAKAVTKLQDLLPNLKDGYKLEAVKTSE